MREGITAGCGNGNYCPNNPVTRQQMAVFLFKTHYGATYVPPAGVGLFGDVAPCPGAVCDFIEDLYNQQITGGCQASPLLYCPGSLRAPAADGGVPGEDVRPPALRELTRFLRPNLAGLIVR